MKQKVIFLNQEKRSCGECAKCCEGWLWGESHGYHFYSGMKCHFLEKTCTIYDDRPEDPCKSYQCLWLVDKNIPAWLKPSLSNVILTRRKLNDVFFVDVVEAGQKIDSSVLNWLMLWAINNNINMRYFVGGGPNKIGSKEFLELEI